MARYCKIPNTLWMSPTSVIGDSLYWGCTRGWLGTNEFWYFSLLVHFLSSWQRKEHGMCKNLHTQNYIFKTNIQHLWAFFWCVVDMSGVSVCVMKFWDQQHKTGRIKILILQELLRTNSYILEIMSYVPRILFLIPEYILEVTEFNFWL